ncbi:hypothetical protein LTR04_005113 [Oleoguttula sp. CCFEE 6159]|nr:hypothetical protein LTR04_005113 [Oleoguttula sp. CCFEE 6159]
MISQRLAVRRIPPLLRPLRPPNAYKESARPRLFTQNSQLLLISPAHPRPQLPYLHQTSRRLPHTPHLLLGRQSQLARLLTTESKRYIKDQFLLAGKWTLYGWTALFLLGIIALGVQNEILERQYPSPHDWSFWSRMNFRNARAQENPDFTGRGVVDWASTGNAYRILLRRLENPAIDGKGLETQEEGGILTPDVGAAGYDIEGKSYQWRRGYFEVLMGCARAAEHLDGWVRDKTRNIAFPADVVIGPSNPNPRPTPPHAASAPQEADCEPAFEAPQTFYLKILTSKGFTTRQHLDAALAYADFLDFKNLHDSAEEVYKWGLVIASSAIPDYESIIDTPTGTIKEDAPTVSPNILQAATSLAIHHARTGAVSSALPIFLSALRARRAAPTSSASPYPDAQPDNDHSLTSPYRKLASTLLSYVQPPAYPSPGPSGDEPLTRPTTDPDCTEAALMTYIGEILFATSASPVAGLGWTRDAVDVAEARLQSRHVLVDGGEKERCSQCLDTGLANWTVMLRKLAREEREHDRSKSRGWSWWGGEKVKEGDVGRWEQELERVEERRERVRREVLRVVFAANSGRAPGSVWMG